MTTSVRAGFVDSGRSTSCWRTSTPSLPSRSSVRIKRTEQFVRDYRGLAQVNRQRVDRALRRFLADPSVPGLCFGKLVGRQDPDGRDISYFRASQSQRITCARTGDLVILCRVGHHDIERTP